MVVVTYYMLKNIVIFYDQYLKSCVYSVYPFSQIICPFSYFHLVPAPLPSRETYFQVPNIFSSVCP